MEMIGIFILVTGIQEKDIYHRRLEIVRLFSFLSDIGCKVNVSSGFYTLSLTCSVCGRIFDIRTTNLKVYTREVVKTWKCLVCNEREKS